jgi:hypothetical protein
LQDAFWLTAENNAARAKEIAECRGEQLLIYFASDDVRLRKVARRRLSRWGKVVWGLRESDVGHASPQWRPVDEETIGKAAQRFLDEPSVSASASPDAQRAEVEVSLSGAPATVEVKRSNDLIVQVKKDEEAVALHGEMAIVEWWILANAQWLQSHSGTSFSDSASGWGLGPLGGMERIDIVHGPGHVSVTHRRNWTEGRDQDNTFCHEVGAADPDQARHCPNN